MNKIKNRIEKTASQEETRTYKLTSSPEFLNKIEQVLATMQELSVIGASSDIVMFVDGDGAFRLKVEKEGGELAPHSDDMESEQFKYSFD